MEVAEGNLKPKLPEDHGEIMGELTNLISISWDQDASIRPTFSTVTSTLKLIRSKLIASL